MLQVDLRKVAQMMGDAFGNRARFTMVPQPIGIMFNIVVPGPDGTDYTRAWLVLYSDLDRSYGVSSMFVNDVRRHVRFLRTMLDMAIDDHNARIREQMVVRPEATPPGYVEPVTPAPANKVIDFTAAASRLRDGEDEL